MGSSGSSSGWWLDDALGLVGFAVFGWLGELLVVAVEPTYVGDGSVVRLFSEPQEKTDLSGLVFGELPGAVSHGARR